MLRWMGKLWGYVTVLLQGDTTERFINLCGFHRLDMWDFCTCDQGVTVKVRISDYKKLRSIAKQTDIRLHIISKQGVPFFVHRHRRRYGLLVGGLLFIIILNILCGKIWTIEIHGVENRERIIQILSEYGVKPGVAATQYDWPTLRQNIIRQYPEISWMSFNPHGTELQVDVTQRITPPELSDEHQPANVMAAFDGTILELQVHNGKAMVEVGEGVVKGDLLISGAVEAKDGCTYFRHASGKVIAQTKRRISVSVPLTQTNPQFTGEAVTRRVLHCFGISIPLYIGSIQNDYVKETKMQSLIIDDVTLPLSIETGIFRFTRPVTVQLNEQEAMAEAIEKIDTQIENNFADVTVIHIEYHQKQTEQALHVTAELTCKENIGIEEKLLIF